MAKAGDEIGTVAEIWRYPVQSMRCVMTTLPQGDLPMDPAILHTATAHNNTRAGVYASVVRPGAIKIGDGAPARLKFLRSTR